MRQPMKVVREVVSGRIRERLMKAILALHVYDDA
jgi:hypothetical protein